MDHIENIYTNYQPLVEEFGEEMITDRYSIIYTEIQEFFKSIRGGDKLSIDPVVLMHTVLDYYSDVSSMKRFHGWKTIDRVKSMAYESFWLLRRKPIQIQAGKGQADDKLTFSNEKFVFSRIASYLVHNSGNIDLLKEQNNQAFQKYLDSLYYFLKYKNYDAQMLEIMMLGFQAGAMAAQK